MTLRILAPLLAALLAIVPVMAGRQLSYVDIIHQLTDLDRLMYWQDGLHAGQASSYDRAEHQRWGSNGDAGKYIRVEQNGEAVMAELQGPGCMY